MIKAQFLKENVLELKSLIGKKLLYYKSQKLDEWKRIYGNFAIKVGEKEIEIRNEEQTIDFFGSKEDVAIYSMKTMTGDTEFKLMVLDTPITEYEVNENIDNINIVTDNIVVRDKDGNIIYEIEIDMAIIFKTENHFLTFAKGWYFDESISVYDTEDYLDLIRSIKQVEEDWADEEDGDTAVCNRRITDLSKFIG